MYHVYILANGYAISIQLVLRIEQLISNNLISFNQLIYRLCMHTTPTTTTTPSCYSLACSLLCPTDMPAAPLWDPALCQFVGLLSVTDFIDVLMRYRQTRMDVSTLATRSIADTLASSQKTFESADTSTSLKQACLMLHRNGLDFLPIVFPEDMRVLATVTYSNILEHVVTHFREQRRLFDDSIYDLQIGTYNENLITIGPDRLLADALELLHQHKLSALPVVDANGKIISVYCRSDITFFLANTGGTDAEDAIANLDLTLADIIAQQRPDMVTSDALHTCSKGHTLQSIFECFAQLRFNRLYVVDEQDICVGVVSARDLVAYFLEE